MKLFSKSTLIIMSLIGMLLSMVYCTKRDHVLNPNSPSAFSGPGDTLFSAKVASGPTFVTGLGAVWDGTLDPMWNTAIPITEHVVVPDLGNNTFTGYIGNSTNVTLRSLYDANNIYILAEWNCAYKCCCSSPWYFNPATKRWAQESSVPTYDANGVMTRPPFIQDQFVMMFNIDNSCADFNSQSCYGACHVCTPKMILDTITGNINQLAVYGGVMRTNGPGEKLDAWRARMLQTLNANQANDVFLDWGNGAINVNEVHNDPEINPFTKTSNKQTLTIKGTKTKVSVPVWVNLAGNYSNGAILAKDTSSCVFVIGVDSTGVLHYAVARGGAETGTINPASGSDFVQVGNGDGPKCIPGSVVGLYTGSRGDVSANAFWTGSGYKLIMKRALKTNDVLKQDVDFSSLQDQSFGIGVMFNGADNEHAIKPGLTLRFKK
jgi:hypothetical protein